MYRSFNLVCGARRETLSKRVRRPQLMHTLRAWLFITMSLLIFLNICGGLLELFLEKHQSNVERSTNMVDGDLETLLFSTIDQETGLRRYITTADPAFLAPFYQGRKMYQATLPQLTQILKNEEFINTKNVFTQCGGHILVEISKEETQVHVCVHDQGIGIPKEALEAIFHPYNRVHAEDTRYIKGTGLGLPIVRHLIDLHGGSIWAESVAGQGSTFHFTLPIKRRTTLLTDPVAISVAVASADF